VEAALVLETPAREKPRVHNLPCGVAIRPSGERSSEFSYTAGREWEICTGSRRCYTLGVRDAIPEIRRKHPAAPLLESVERIIEGWFLVTTIAGPIS
jgi:hypothetical protein